VELDVIFTETQSKWEVNNKQYRTKDRALRNTGGEGGGMGCE